MAMDFKQFESLKNNYEKVLKDFNTFIEDFLFEQAMRALRKTKLRTPVDTGALRNAWDIDKNVQREGNTLCIKIFNPLEYASFVEYGHTKRNRIGWVDGFFMAKVSIQEVQDAIPRRWNKEFSKFINNLTEKGGANA